MPAAGKQQPALGWAMQAGGHSLAAPSSSECLGGQCCQLQSHCFGPPGSCSDLPSTLHLKSCLPKDKVTDFPSLSCLQVSSQPSQCVVSMQTERSAVLPAAEAGQSEHIQALCVTATGRHPALPCAHPAPSALPLSGWFCCLGWDTCSGRSQTRHLGR